MVQIIGSQNFKYYVVKLANELRLYGGISGGLVQTSEVTKEWTRQIDLRPLGSMINLTNAGETYFQGPEGIVSLRNQKTPVRPTSFPPIRADLSQAGHEFVTGCVDAEGVSVFYEISSPEVGLKEKLRGLFARGQASTSKTRTVFRLEPNNMRRSVLTETQVEVARANQFRWTCSPFHRFALVIQPTKKALQVEVIDLGQAIRKIPFSFPLDTNIGYIAVTDTGTILLEVRKDGDEVLLVKSFNKKDQPSQITPPRGFQVLRLGNDFIVLHYPKNDLLLVYQFNNQASAEVYLTPLLQESITPFFNILENGDMNVLFWSKDTLYIHYSTVKSLNRDGQRWHNIAREKVLSQEQAYTRETIERYQDEARQTENRHLSQFMAADVNREDFFIDVPPVSGAPPARIEALSMDEAVPPTLRAPSLPEIPIVGPPGPMPVSDFPPVSFHSEPPGFQVPVSFDLPSVPHLPEPGVAPALNIPAAAPETAQDWTPPQPLEEIRPLSVLLEQAESKSNALDFLSGALLSAPSTEDDEEGPPSTELSFLAPSQLPDSFPEVNAPVDVGLFQVSITEPAPTPEPEFVFQGDPDAELERLRMLYIAGELTREDYHDRKSALEKYKARLSLDQQRILEAPSAIDPSEDATSRRARRLDI